LSGSTGWPESTALIGKSYAASQILLRRNQSIQLAAQLVQERSLVTVHCRSVSNCLERIMRLSREMITMATVSILMLIQVGTAGAQSFDERWSIIPKAHAEPAPEPRDNTAQTPQTKPSTEETIPRASEDRPVARSHRVFSGKASYYSYRKAKTATGASFNRESLTAAHRSLPFGTKVRVTDVGTNRSVIVRINDRGPNIRGRVLDLSLGAARSLGITNRGVVQIRVEVL
jgi:rare lipoprotein A